jgi:hypothetical protein
MVNVTDAGAKKLVHGWRVTDQHDANIERVLVIAVIEGKLDGIAFVHASVRCDRQPSNDCHY